ncbi:MAG TPA: 6-phosphogluconolactonase [Polyangiaceae bacterium]|jgi:6-phosphogluconolactonase|nr:6-phosphogluconolactonase [Polyangiaceae bacterium]
MTTHAVPGQLIASREPAQVAREAANRIAGALEAAIETRGRASLGLSGGNTPLDAYRLLAQARVDWTMVHIFWVDERAVPPHDDRSNYRWAKTTLLDPAKVPSECIHRMEAERPDLDAAARDYEKTLRIFLPSDSDGVPCFDALVLGVGDDGHTASLFPGEPTVDLSSQAVAVVPAGGAHEARLTVTAPIIEHARYVFVLAVGRKKHPALVRVWDVAGDAHQTPARILRLCRGTLVWIVDRAAAGLE